MSRTDRIRVAVAGAGMVYQDYYAAFAAAVAGRGEGGRMAGHVGVPKE